MDIRSIKKTHDEFNRDQKILFAVFNAVFLLFVLAVIIITYLKIMGVFSGELIPEKKFLELTSYSIYWHGIFLALGFFTALLYLVFKTRKEKHQMTIFSSFLWLIFFGILTGRITYIFLNWELYVNNFNQVFNFIDGGVSLLGGMIFGILIFSIFNVFEKVRIWKMLDFFAVPFIIGKIIAQWSSIFSQGLFGTPTESLLKFYVSPFNRPIEYRDYSYFHPLFLYEIIFDIFILIIIAFFDKEKKEGNLFLNYVIFYSAFRFFIGFITVDQGIFLGLNFTQIVALVFFITLILIKQIRKERGEEKQNGNRTKRKNIGAR